MNKKIAIAMAGNVAFALLVTTGCHSLTTGRTVFGDQKVDPYEYDTPQITITEPDTTTTQVTPTVVAPAVVDTPAQTTESQEQPYVAPTATETSPSYQRYVVPTDYENPTAGLTPVKDRPDYTEPAPTTPATPADTSADEGYFTYVVKAGDCLSVIANSNGVRTRELAELNGLKPDAQVRIGQKLKVPAGRKPFSSTPATPRSADVTDGSVYVVKAGDCLSVIAQNLGVKTADLMAINNIKNANNIYVGQKLKIPGKATKAPTTTTPAAPVVTPAEKPATDTPVVVPPAPVEAEDPFSLDQDTKALVPPAPIEAPVVVPPAPIEAEDADEFDFDLDAVIEQYESTAAQSAATPAAKKYDTVKVVEGDTIELIAANYDTTVEIIREINGFDSSKKLKPGEVIKIPSQSAK